MLKTIRSFFKINDYVSEKQLNIARKYLGYSSNITTKKLRFIFWKSFFINFIRILKIYYNIYLQKFLINKKHSLRNYNF